MEKRYQVFVSSTYADLKQERQKVIQALMEMDCIPSGMELFPAADEEQLVFIKRIIDDCDYYLLIIGGRYGSTTPEGISYTEKEYDYAIEKGIKVIGLLHANPEDIPFSKTEVDPVLRERLLEFRKKVSSNRLVKYWNNAHELPGLVALSLQKTIKAFPAVGWIKADSISNDQVLNGIKEFQKENKNLRESVEDFSSVIKHEIKPEIIGLTDNLFRQFKGMYTEEYLKTKDGCRTLLMDAINQYRKEISILNSLKDAGSIKPYRNRLSALTDFSSAIDVEINEIMIIGSSLLGLLNLDRFKDIAEKIRFKILSAKVNVKFLLTHPVFADLRVRQESRNPKSIGKEIIKTLMKLQEWGVPEENVKLYKGAPTCFAIRTTSKMFLNPYPYIAPAYDSPCLIIETSSNTPSYFYNAFDRAHFGAWETVVAEKIGDYNTIIEKLEGNLDKYSENANQMFFDM
jgi:hypothetical protein